MRVRDSQCSRGQYKDLGTESRGKSHMREQTQTLLEVGEAEEEKGRGGLFFFLDLRFWFSTKRKHAFCVLRSRLPMKLDKPGGKRRHAG